jgi:hypothetical protein
VDSAVRVDVVAGDAEGEADVRGSRPVTLTLGGVEHSLTLDEARALYGRLIAAIADAEARSRPAIGSDEYYEEMLARVLR